MGKIALLEQEVIDQIAAGEVLENPASAVKELIENSVDAGATSIEVEIEAGGQQLIRVIDDGIGMDEEDARLALVRHATSKLKNASDLWRLTTLGFRGEALAAIGSVSKLRLETFDGVRGTAIEMEGGKIVSLLPVARNRGTTVTIRSLFYNVPARRKFLKSVSACATQVEKAVREASLAHPELSFSLRVDGESQWKKQGSTLWDTVQALLPDVSLRLDCALRGLHIQGMVGEPGAVKRNRSGQHVFLNRRPIVSPLISRALKEGFGTRIAEGEFPIAALYIEMEAESVDVNVHPQKKEVRFRSEEAVFTAVREAVRRLFEPPIPLDRVPISPFEGSLPLWQAPIETFQGTAAEGEGAPLALREQAPLPWEEAAQVEWIQGRFALIREEKLFLFDIGGARARLAFERSETEQGAVQPLLWPIELTTELPADSLSSCGIECRDLGRGRVAIDALPSWLEPEEIPLFATALAQGKKASAICRICRSKPRATAAEAALLWRSLKLCKDPRFDPLGRRIWREIGEEEWEEWLERK
jgi:DNA mismatch repair protein MutL